MEENTVFFNKAYISISLIGYIYCLSYQVLCMITFQNHPTYQLLCIKNSQDSKPALKSTIPMTVAGEIHKVQSTIPVT